jgi:hypothetical protein
VMGYHWLTPSSTPPPQSTHPTPSLPPQPTTRPLHCPTRHALSMLHPTPLLLLSTVSPPSLHPLPPTPVVHPRMTAQTAEVRERGRERERGRGRPSESRTERGVEYRTT